MSYSALESLNNELGGLSDVVKRGHQGELAVNTGYSYDAIGNLIKDTREAISGIDGSTYGQTKQIKKAPGISLILKNQLEILRNLIIN